jgi:hypothetical protein
MKSLRIVAFSLVVVLWAVPAHADSIPDPHFKTGGAGGGGAVFQFASQSVPAAIITQDFSISSPSGASPADGPCFLIQGPFTTQSNLCDFKNEINVGGLGVAITKLLFDVGGLKAGTLVSCGFLAGSPFARCTSGTANADGFAQVTFFDGSVPFDAVFSLEYGSPTDPFPPNSKSGVTASVSPEPGTLALFLGGIGALLIGRKLRPRSLS